MKKIALIILVVLPVFCQAKIRAIAIQTGSPTTLAANEGESKNGRTSVALNVPTTAIKVIYQISTYAGKNAPVNRQLSSLVAQVNQLLDKDGVQQIQFNITRLMPFVDKRSY